MKKLTRPFLMALGFFLLGCTRQSPVDNASATHAVPVKAVELANRFFTEVANQHKMALLDEILHPSFRSHQYPAPPGSDKAQFMQGMIELLAAFPDIAVTVHDQYGQGNKVFTYFSWAGTHKGTFNGIAPTNKQVKVDGMDIWREQDGQLVENWVVMDIMGLMVQLGVVPPPPPKQ